MWAKLKPDIPTIEVVSQQNNEIEAAILFYENVSVWHMVDRADRRHAGKSIAGKAREILQGAIDIIWVQVFGLFKKLSYSKKKKSIAPQSVNFFSRHGIDLQNKTKG